MNKYIKALQGISYPEWTKLKIGIDKEFERQKSESEKTFKLADVKNVEMAIRSQFGRI